MFPAGINTSRVAQSHVFHNGIHILKLERYRED
jgi:hypothetical protein